MIAVLWLSMSSTCCQNIVHPKKPDKLSRDQLGELNILPGLLPDLQKPVNPAISENSFHHFQKHCHHIWQKQKMLTSKVTKIFVWTSFFLQTVGTNFICEMKMDEKWTNRRCLTIIFLPHNLFSLRYDLIYFWKKKIVIRERPHLECWLEIIGDPFFGCDSEWFGAVENCHTTVIQLEDEYA